MNIFDRIRKCFGLGSQPDNLLYDRIIEVTNTVIALSTTLESVQKSYDESELELTLKLQACDALIDKGNDSEDILRNKVRLHSRILSLEKEQLEEVSQVTKALMDAVSIHETLQKSIDLVCSQATNEQTVLINKAIEDFKTGILKADSEDHALCVGLLNANLADKVLELSKATHEDFKLRWAGFDPSIKDKETQLTTNVEPSSEPEQGSVAVMVRNEDGKILFLKRSMDDDLAPGTWCLPGGGIDPGESAIEAAVRELKEESNIDCTTDDLLLVGKIKVDSGKIIHYYNCCCEPGIIALLDGENTNYYWMDSNDWKDEDLILDLKLHLAYMFQSKSVDDNSELVIEVQKSLDSTNDIHNISLIEKGGRKAEIGEERIYGGVKYQKTAQGWKPVGNGKRGPSGEDDSKGGGRSGSDKQSSSGAAQKKTLGEHARGTPEKELRRVIAESHDEHLRSIAKQELDRRNKEEGASKAPGSDSAKQNEGESNDKSKENDKPKTFKQKLKEKFKGWHSKQKEFYQHGGNEPHSQARSAIANFLRKKTKGIIAGVKHEVHEWKDAGSGLKKLFTGQKSKLTNHEKKAMKTVGIHLAITVGMMAATGGLGALAKHGGAALTKHIALHYLEHAGVTRLAHAAIFASMEDELFKGIDTDSMDEEGAIQKLLEGMINYIESGAIGDDDWMKISDASDQDFHLIDDEN